MQCVVGLAFKKKTPPSSNRSIINWEKGTQSTTTLVWVQDGRGTDAVLLLGQHGGTQRVSPLHTQLLAQRLSEIRQKKKVFRGIGIELKYNQTGQKVLRVISRM